MDDVTLVPAPTLPLCLALDRPLGRRRRGRRLPLISFDTQRASLSVVVGCVVDVVVVLAELFSAYTFRLLPPARTYTSTTAVRRTVRWLIHLCPCPSFAVSAVCVFGGRLRC